MKSIVLTTLFLLGTGLSFAQPAERRISRDEYIEMWKDEAMTQMYQHGIPASITLAQGILESANGNSALAKYANNHFGIKCHGWKGESFIQDDDAKNECFRKYESAGQSFTDHSDFLTGRSRYAFLFDMNVQDYKSWAHGLKKAGYATNPKYGYLLVDLIEQHHLYQYDRPVDMASTKKPKQIENVSEDLVIHAGHTIEFKDNGVRFVVAGSGDTFYKVSKEFGLTLNQLYKYNDLGKDATLHAGDVLYIQSKKGRAKTERHVVQKGENLWKISQAYGIKLKKLRRKNGLLPTDEVKAGDVLYLRKRKP